jgi:hypothetical protein
MVGSAEVYVRPSRSYRVAGIAALSLSLATLVGCGTSSPAATSKNDPSPDLMLQDGLLQEFVGFFGVTVSADEVECLDSHLSQALGIPYPATWSSYKAAMEARVATVVSAFEATGELVPDPLPGEAMQTCLTEENKNVLSAKWSDLTNTQRTCLLEQAAPYKRSVPEAGISQDEIAAACEIA